LDRATPDEITRLPFCALPKPPEQTACNPRTSATLARARIYVSVAQAPLSRNRVHVTPTALRGMIMGRTAETTGPGRS